jgi:hypothetical protein
LESIGAMTEILDLARLSMSDRPQLEEMNGDRDTALSASATLANESQDPTARQIDHFKRLLGQVDPPIPILLSEGDELREAAKVLGKVRVRLPVPPEQLELGIKVFRKGFAG